MSKISQDASESQDFAFDDDLIEINVNNQVEDEDDLSEVQFIEQLKKGQNVANQQTNSQNQIKNSQQNNIQSQNYQQGIEQNDDQENLNHEGEIVSFREDILEQIDESECKNTLSQKNENLNNSFSYSNQNKSQNIFYNEENLQQEGDFSGLNIFQRNQLQQEFKKLSAKKDEQLAASQGSLEDQLKVNSQQLNNFSSQNQFTSNFEQEFDMNNLNIQSKNQQNIFSYQDSSNQQQQSQLAEYEEKENQNFLKKTYNIGEEDNAVNNDNDHESSNLLELPVFENEKQDLLLEDKLIGQQNNLLIEQNQIIKENQDEEEEDDDEDEMILLKNIANTYHSQQRQKQSEELSQGEQKQFFMEKESPQKQQIEQENENKKQENNEQIEESFQQIEQNNKIVNQQDQVDQLEIKETQHKQQNLSQEQQQNSEFETFENKNQQEIQNTIQEDKQNLITNQDIIEQDLTKENYQLLNQNQDMQQDQESNSELLQKHEKEARQEGLQMIDENEIQQNNQNETQQKNQNEEQKNELENNFNNQIFLKQSIEQDKGINSQEHQSEINNLQVKENESKKMEIEYQQSTDKQTNEKEQSIEQEGKQQNNQQKEEPLQAKQPNNGQIQYIATQNECSEENNNPPKKSISEAPQTIASIFQQLASVFQNMIIPQSMINMSLNNNTTIEQQPEQFQTSANIQQQINQLQNQVTFIQNSVIHIPNHLQQVTNILAKVTNSNITVNPNIQQLTSISNNVQTQPVNKITKEQSQVQKQSKDTKQSTSKEDNEKAKKPLEKSRNKKADSSEDEESEEDNESSEEESGSESEEESDDENDISDLKNLSSKISNSNQKSKIGSGTLSSKSNNSLFGFGSSINKKTTYIQPKNNFSAPKMITTPTKGLTTSFGSSKIEPPQEPQIDQITINAASIGFKEPKLFIAESERVIKSDDIEIEDESLKPLYEYLNKLDQPTSFLIIKDQFQNLTDEQIHTALHDFKSEEKIGIVELFLPKYAKCNSARIDYYYVEMIIPPPKPKQVEPEHTEEQKENTVEKQELKIENAGDRKKYESMTDDQLLSYQKELNLRKQALLDKKQNANPTSDRLKKIQQWNEMKEVISTVFERIAVLKGKRIQEICDDFGVKLED
ncbi:L-allo-threonine aldolase (macronuclear) [Tetrahymena thermophila SB210]|uniref:L-allo-threonine aldolase n=1 Tax=Tetrahymena thermophila (strain SB210) TaxID=312017 RepID=Q24HJ9_TETTS|nr:L-allo-threonine aldolase [Tetrahymena thermophila SB210]EAS07232.2 L-allo-threonine aldolase [Tetrahymena thermophila SB210]|eukprot:XP_001027474.2 L-allo-threonine aldolase [Tetrahymena thermophila SB210]